MDLDVLKLFITSSYNSIPITSYSDMGPSIIHKNSNCPYNPNEMIAKFIKTKLQSEGDPIVTFTAAEVVELRHRPEDPNRHTIRVLPVQETLKSPSLP
jgi:hypothetical protein